MEKQKELSITAILQQVENLYAQNLREHGISSKALGWKDESGQLLRFQKLCTVIEPDEIKGITVNDLGSGLGGLFQYLETLKHVTVKNYYGYEISHEMLEKAGELIIDKRVEFYNTDKIIKQADYAFASGIFNVKFSANNEEWDDYVKETLLHMAKMSVKGIAFNVLSSYVDWQEPHLFYADPLNYFDFCKKNISKYVTLIHDYPLYEWTMMMRMNP